MRHEKRVRPSRSVLLLAAALALSVASAGTAQTPAPAAGQPSRSQNVTINLIRRLVERGALTPADATELIKLAEEDAVLARAEAAAPSSPSAASAPVAPAAPIATAAPATPAVADDTVRVTYIPDFLRRQMVEEVRQDVMNEAVAENWAAPRTFPDWVARLKIFGDVRVRYEGLYYPKGNDNTGAFPNFNAINTGSPFDIAGSVFSPQYNVDQNRQRLRLRARAGLAVDLGENFSSGLRLATGENNSPVTQNQSFGAANSAQGGNFSKYAVWLDRAFIKYQLWATPEKELSTSVGRFDNPFFATSLLWADDLGFDGAVAQAKYRVLESVTPFATVGAFPIFNTDLNFASTQPAKFKSEDKWLAAGQLGADWAVTEKLSVRLGIAYYDFKNVAGRLSTPFVPVVSSDAGDSDATRPAFAQRGNTYMALRSIAPSVLNNFGTINQWQYFGLATPFRDVALTGKIDLVAFEPFVVSLSGEYVRNLDFNRTAIAAKAVNNLGAATTALPLGAFEGGDTAWTVNLRFGKPALERRWDWSVGLAYRYVESDSTIDGFADSDFGGGGTNAKGYVFNASLALSERVSLGLRWMSARSIAGPAYKNDTLQIDTSAKF